MIKITLFGCKSCYSFLGPGVLCYRCKKKKQTSNQKAAIIITLWGWGNVSGNITWCHHNNLSHFETISVKLCLSCGRLLMTAHKKSFLLCYSPWTHYLESSLEESNRPVRFESAYDYDYERFSHNGLVWRERHSTTSFFLRFLKTHLCSVNSCRAKQPRRGNFAPLFYNFKARVSGKAAVTTMLD